jgi:hypothetical protein
MQCVLAGPVMCVVCAMSSRRIHRARCEGRNFKAAWDCGRIWSRNLLFSRQQVDEQHSLTDASKSLLSASEL